MKERVKYITPTPRDKAWGITVTSVGQQDTTQNECQRQDGYRLIYITQGCGVLECPLTLSQKVHSGEMLLLYPGESYTLRPYTETEWEACHVAFEGHIVDEKIRTGFFDRRKSVFAIGVYDSVTAIFKEIYKLVGDDAEGSRYYAASLVYMLLGRILYKNTQSTTGNDAITNLIERAKTIMNDGCQESMEKISERVGLPYSRFRREFKRLCGVSPGQYCMKQKMEKAKHLLRDTDMSIAEIATQMGFGYQGELSALFKKHIGISPIEFRKQFEAYYTARTK